MNELTNEDIAVLLKALDALKGKATSDGLMSAMLGAALMGSKKSDSEMESFFDDTLNKAKSESERIEETVILLKAKLITMRDKETAKSACDFLRGNSARDE